MNKITILISLYTLALFISSCVIMKSNKPQLIHGIDVQGHRGARGVLPENSIPAFIYALEVGVTSLEMDVVISRDKQVVVSHEAFMSSEICLQPDGSEISKEEAESHNIYQLSYEEVKTYDCGSKVNHRFKEQEKMSVYKPSLREVVQAAEKLSKKHLYNIEIKSRPEGDLIYHPEVGEYSDLLIKELEGLGILSRTSVQSFDTRTLKYIRSNYPHVSLVYLIQNRDGIEANIDKLGFTPEIYSPYYGLVNQKMRDYCTEHKMKLIPWTVNRIEDMSKMIELSVDGIITDYPLRLINTINQSVK
ncbi:MAG: glycerophosphodiester phosphodiesterase family protein [Saprospiraceae bacterium]|jgi:glycerophosphoryl diester phosphodiesterase